MLWLWWQLLSLLVLIQLLEPKYTSYKLYDCFCEFACQDLPGRWCEPISEALVSENQKTSGRIGRSPQWRSVYLHKQNNPGLVSSSPRSDPHFLQAGCIKLSPFSPNIISSSSSINFWSSSRRIVATDSYGSNVPTLTPPQTDDENASKQRVAATIGGVGAAVLVVFIVVLVYVCLMRVRKIIRRSSGTASSIRSPPFELEGGNGSPNPAPQSPLGPEHPREFKIQELEHATRNFSQSNIIGEGVFGLTYKGLLLDGSIAAIKRRLHYPIQNFLYEAKNIASIRHKNLVKLIGYCDDQNQQLLAYEYISNGNVANYLYDNEGLPLGKLDMRQRLSIALAAAKGLKYLHSLDPPFLHMHFRTSNVLVDEDFGAKLSDYGLFRLVNEGQRAGSSSSFDCFLDPELNSSNYLEQNDVYSFGVFLLELVSGREAHGKHQSNSEENLVSQAKGSSFSDLVDKTLGEHGIAAAKQLIELALVCIDTCIKRPTMATVVRVMEHIQRSITGRLHSEVGEGRGAAVTLGSELFK